MLCVLLNPTKDLLKLSVLSILLSLTSFTLAADKPDYATSPTVQSPAPQLPPAVTTKPVVVAPQPPTMVVSDYSQQGLVRWYPATAHGRRTASGDIYDIYQFTAAHAQLPFGAQVRVTNIATQRSVIVRINDKLTTPTANTIVQLSFAAAKHLGLLSNPQQPVALRGLPPL